MGLTHCNEIKSSWA